MSATKQCRNLEVGDCAYIECETIAQSHGVTNRMNTIERLPKDMKELRFKCVTYTAVALQGGKIIYINKVTRIK